MIFRYGPDAPGVPDAVYQSNAAFIILCEAGVPNVKSLAPVPPYATAR